MKDDTVKHELDMNKQMDQLVRQGVSFQRVINDLEDETESLREEVYTSVGMSVIKHHTELLVEEHNALLTRILHEVFSVLHRTRSTWTLKNPGVMPEM